MRDSSVAPLVVGGRLGVRGRQVFPVMILCYLRVSTCDLTAGSPQMQTKGKDNDHEKPAKRQKMVAAGKLELELVRARAEDKEAQVELQQALEDRDEAVRIATRQSMNTILFPVHTIARNANAGQQYEYAPFVSHSVDQREMHWQGAYAPQQPYSAVLHRILTIVKKLPASELPWVGELVLRQAKSKHNEDHRVQ